MYIYVLRSLPAERSFGLKNIVGDRSCISMQIGDMQMHNVDIKGI
jgi:hypothetical protein